jgi:phospholipid/cholesterol/gamma-HCH transport system substrate-binding protein
MTTHGQLRARMREMAAISPLGTAMVILQTVAAIAVIVLVVHAEGLRIPLFSSSPYTLTAYFSDADGLTQSKKPSVTVAGVLMGTVSNVSYRDGQATVKMDLKDSARGKIFSNATALISPRSAINDLTVDITPGSPAAGPLRTAVIPQSRTQTAVNLDRLTDILNVDTRAQLSVLATELGIGLAGRSRSLDQAIAELSPFISTTQGLASEMARRQQLLSELVGNLDAVFTTLASRGTQLRQLITAGQTTLGAVAANQANVAQTMRELAPALANTSQALANVKALAGPLDPALDALKPLAGQLPSGLAALRSFVPEGNGLASDLETLDRAGPRGAQALQSFLGELKPASTALLSPVQKLLPAVQGLDRHPTGIGELGSNFSGVFSGQNANGPTLRAYGFFEPVRPENFGLPAGTSSSTMSDLRARVARALDVLCSKTNPAACLARVLTPLLPAPTASDGALH